MAIPLLLGAQTVHHMFGRRIGLTDLKTHCRRSRDFNHADPRDFSCLSTLSSAVAARRRSAIRCCADLSAGDRLLWSDLRRARLYELIGRESGLDVSSRAAYVLRSSSIGAITTRFSAPDGVRRLDGVRTDLYRDVRYASHLAHALRRTC